MSAAETARHPVVQRPNGGAEIALPRVYNLKNPQNYQNKKSGNTWRKNKHWKNKISTYTYSVAAKNKNPPFPRKKYLQLYSFIIQL